MILPECPEDEDFCRCLIKKCPIMYNYSVDLMEECYMSTCFLPKQVLPISSLIKVTSLYLVLFAVGFGGNVLTCIVICKHPMLKTNSRWYLLNLAIADLVTICVGLPFEIVMNWNQYPWPFPDWVCNLKALIAETTTSVSILTILFFSIERYIAVCQPFVFVKIKKLLPKYVVSFLVISWIISICCSGPFAYYHKADYWFKNWPDTNDTEPIYSSKMCMMQGVFDPAFIPTFKILFHFSALAFFVFPLFIIFILYALIAKRVIHSKVEIDSFGKDFGRQTEEEGPKKVTTILCAIVFTFFICYLPFQFQRLAFFYLDPDTVQHLNQYIYFISGILFYLAPIINPIVYNVVSSRFRRAFKEVLTDLCGRRCGRNRVISARASYNYNYSHVSDRCIGCRTTSVEV